MNLFGGGANNKDAAAKMPATPPSLDQAIKRVQNLRREQSLRGRAAAMLVDGGTPTVAKRNVTGN